VSQAGDDDDSFEIEQAKPVKKAAAKKAAASKKGK